MFRVALDARLISQTGVGVYTRNLINELQKIESDIRFTLLARTEDVKTIKLTNPNFTLKIADIPWHSFAEQTSFLAFLRKEQYDLIHFTYFSYPILYHRPFVITIHDLTPYLFKTGRASTRNPLLFEIKHQTYKLALSSAIANSRFIITPTFAIKKEIIAHFGKHLESKITPIHEGVDQDLLTSHPIPPKNFDSKAPYYLYVGNFYPHKNVERLTQAFHATKSKSYLILAGPRDFFASRIEKQVSSLKDSRIKMLLQTKKEEMAYLYSHASALIHPSLSEGFGLPLLEATYFDCPVLASNSAVFDEILDNDRLSFDPKSETSICKAIEKCERLSTQERKKLVHKEILSRFSFSKMTTETISLYKKILSSAT